MSTKHQAPSTKHQALIAFLVCLFATNSLAGVSEIKASGTAGRLDQVSDSYTASSSNPGYQPLNLGGTWSPDISLDNTSGTPMSINLNNASGTPAISLNRATGSIAGTSGTNSSINSAINSSINSAIKSSSINSAINSSSNNTTINSSSINSAINSSSSSSNTFGTWVHIGTVSPTAKNKAGRINISTSGISSGHSCLKGLRAFKKEQNQSTQWVYNLYDCN